MTPETPPKAIAPGSLFNSSEGLLTATLTGIAATVVTEDGFSDELKLVAMGGLSIAVAAYTVARALVKKNA
jgi:hypothetical protein